MLFTKFICSWIMQGPKYKSVWISFYYRNKNVYEQAH